MTDESEFGVARDLHVTTLLEPRARQHGASRAALSPRREGRAGRQKTVAPGR